MRIHSDLADTIGNTPLLRLRKASEMTGCEILGKAEFMNPGQSVKDRAALYIIRDAVAKGLLRPGGTIVEGTAGNTGIGLALVGASMGFRTVIVIPETQSQEKKDMLRLAGAELVQVPAVPYSNPNNYVRYSGRLAEKLAQTEPNGAIWANQFDNVANRQAHIETTGPEIWEQTGGKVDGFICAVGSGGTLAGVAHGAAAQGREDRPRRPGRCGAAQLLHHGQAGKPRARRSPKASGRGGSRPTSKGSRPTSATASRMPRRCRSSSTCCRTRGCAWAARPASTSPARSAWRATWGRARPSSPSCATMAAAISRSSTTRPSCKEKGLPVPEWLDRGAAHDPSRFRGRMTAATAVIRALCLVLALGLGLGTPSGGLGPDPPPPFHRRKIPARRTMSPGKERHPRRKARRRTATHPMTRSADARLSGGVARNLPVGAERQFRAHRHLARPDRRARAGTRRRRRSRPRKSPCGGPS